MKGKLAVLVGVMATTPMSKKGARIQPMMFGVVREGEFGGAIVEQIAIGNVRELDIMGRLVGTNVLLIKDQELLLRMMIITADNFVQATAAELEVGGVLLLLLLGRSEGASSGANTRGRREVEECETRRGSRFSNVFAHGDGDGYGARKQQLTTRAQLWRDEALASSSKAKAFQLWLWRKSSAKALLKNGYGEKLSQKTDTTERSSFTQRRRRRQHRKK